MDASELLRIRDRLHAVEGSIAAVRWRQDALERRCDKMEPKLDELADANMIAKAVTDRMASERDAHDQARTLRLTWTQKALGSAVAVLAIADAIKTLGGW